jgi:hypothetical protein
MNKISDFVIIPEIKAIIVGLGTDDKYLKIYQVYINEKTFILDVKVHQKIKKDCEGRVI